VNYFEQISGRLYDDAGELLGVGYSGFANGKNNPDAQSIHQVGPIPCGLYSMWAPRDSQTHGPFAIPLVPYPENEMFGRAGFLIHGDSVHAPGTASLGCIIQARDVREKVWNSGDHVLKVVARLGEVKPWPV
jgi:hypothetical protein